MVQMFETDFFSDNRGDLWTVWNRDTFKPELEFNHDKVAKSKKRVIRGLHGDNKSWKLITCLYGEIFLVVVDFRKESENFLETKTFILNDVNKRSVLVPPGFLNGHQVLSNDAVFYYKWAYDGEYPDVNYQTSIKWDDPKLNIEWPLEDPILSKRDLTSKYI